jgi:uncharacterized membrane protein
MKRFQSLLAIIVSLIPVILYLSQYSYLPENVVTAYQQNLQPASYGSKQSIFTLLCLLGGISLLSFFASSQVHKLFEGKLIPLYEAGILNQLGWLIVILTSIMGFVIAYTTINPNALVLLKITDMLVGFLVMGIGFILRRLPHNAVFGFKFPKALEDANHWKLIHQFGGWLFIASGAVLCITSLLVPAETNTILMVLLVLGSVIGTAIHHFMLLKKA